MKAPDICKLVGRDKKHLVQLCLPIEKLKGKLTFPVVASEKLDGVFCLAYIEGMSVYIYSRTGEEYTSLKHLKDELWKLSKETQFDVFIFEAYSSYVDQPTISGWCRDTKNQHTSVEAYIHDGMTLEEFKTGDNELCYLDRIEYIHKIFYDNQAFYRNVNIIQFFNCRSYESLMAYADQIWADGGEGVVARQPFCNYQPGKRNHTMVKVKKGVSFDLQVVALEEGKGKYVGKVGKLVCKDAKGTVVKVGSGLSDQERSWWWTEFGYRDILNKIVQIDAMAISSKGVLREPRYKGIREDKKEVDTIE